MVATSCDLNAPRCTTQVLAGTLTHLSMTVFVGCSVKDRPAAPGNYIIKNYKPRHEV